MNISEDEIVQVANIEVKVLRKNIKNMHLSVHPPNGHVRLSAPKEANPDVVRLFAISKLSWLKKNIKNFQEQSRETPRQYVNGESHYFRGHRYLLKVKEKERSAQVQLKGTKHIEMIVKPGATVEEKQILMREWYRSELKKLIPDLIDKWEKVVGVKADDWGVKRMKTKWGACNIEEKRIWLNLELVKKPLICLEYILVHELVHLHERHHNDRFVRLMDQFMPKWRLHREELNSLPVRHEDWGY